MTDNENDANGFWMCYTCGIDMPYKGHSYRKPKYDEFYSDGDEQQVLAELDTYFYQRYPQFDNV